MVISVDNDLALNDKLIEDVKREATEMVRTLMGIDLLKVILYASRARGDYLADSDVDLALLPKCDRMEAKKVEKRQSCKLIMQIIL